MMMKEKEKTLNEVTVIVPTRNEAHNIRPFLQSLPPTIPLIVVDDSEDETPHLVAQHHAKNRLILHRPTTVTEARQLGATIARTSWLLFTDADVVFAPDYFQRLSHYLDRHDVIYGAKLSRSGYQHYYRWFTRGQKLSDRLGIPAASGSNLLIRRSAFQAVDGFDLALTCNEDSEIAWRIKRIGYGVKFVPELIVYARDHRRLERGVLRKTTHSFVRCALLYTGMLPPKWRSSDWGYWSQSRTIRRSDI